MSSRSSRSSSRSRIAKRNAEAQKASSPDIDILDEGVSIHYPLVPGAGQAGIGKGDAVSKDEGSRMLSPSLVHFRDAPLDFLREISLHLSGTGWRGYENPIGQPIFYKGYSENMRHLILTNEKLRKRVFELAKKRVDDEAREGLLGEEPNPGVMQLKKSKRRREIELSLWEVADKIVDGMICKMESKGFIRGAYYFCMQTLARTYHQGVHVSTEEVLRLRACASLAASKKQSLIFLPCHRSHIDYVALQVICYRLGISLPNVVAGDNLNFPIVGSFLQHAGAFFIRRSFGDDKMYPAVVQAYIDAMLQNGYNMECFVEGGRSRTGKLLPPKFGILSYIMDTILSGRVEDAFIIPVSTQYDKVIETEGYVNELLGIPKKKENLMDFLSSSSVLSLRLGRVDIRFHEPWSLREFITDQLTRVPPHISEHDRKNKLLRTLGYKVLADINAVSVVMPVSLIGTVLLTLRGRGIGKSELVRRIEWLSEQIRRKGGRVADFGSVGTETIVERGLEVLGDLVGRTSEEVAEECFYAKDRFQLSFYRNMVIHLFISETIVCCAMYTRIKQGGGPANQLVPYDVLLDHVSFLSKVFRKEFVYPTDGITTNLRQTLIGLEKDRVVDLGWKDDKVNGTIEYVELAREERERGREQFDYYCFLLWPFVEGTWLAAVAVLGLTPPYGEEGDVWVGANEAMDMAQLLGKTLYHQGDLSYFEAVNKETLKNAFQQLTSQGTLLISSSATTPASKSATAQPPSSKAAKSLLRLNPEWAPTRNERNEIQPGGRLWMWTEKLAKSRREGKNRRDAPTVERRVMRLAGRLGLELIERQMRGDDVRLKSRL